METKTVRERMIDFINWGVRGVNVPPPSFADVKKSEVDLFKLSITKKDFSEADWEMHEKALKDPAKAFGETYEEFGDDDLILYSLPEDLIDG